MVQVKVFYEPDTELLTIFWQTPRQNQICSEWGEGVVLIKDGETEELIGMEFLAYQPGDQRLLTADVELGEEYIPAPSMRGRLRQTIDDLIRSSQRMDNVDFEFHRSSSGSLTDKTQAANLQKRGDCYNPDKGFYG